MSTQTYTISSCVILPTKTKHVSLRTLHKLSQERTVESISRKFFNQLSVIKHFFLDCFLFLYYSNVLLFRRFNYDLFNFRCLFFLLDCNFRFINGHLSIVMKCHLYAFISLAFYICFHHDLMKTSLNANAFIHHYFVVHLIIF